MASAAALEKKLVKLEKYGASQKAQDKVRDKLAKQREFEDQPLWKKALFYMLAALILFGPIYLMMKPSEPLTPEQAAIKLDDNRNYAATYALERAIKGNLKDPSSYKFTGGKFIKIDGQDNMYRVGIFYIAANSFNARIPGSAWMLFTFEPGSAVIASTKAEKFE